MGQGLMLFEVVTGKNLAEVHSILDLGKMDTKFANKVREMKNTHGRDIFFSCPYSDEIIDICPEFEEVHWVGARKTVLEIR